MRSTVVVTATYGYRERLHHPRQRELVSMFRERVEQQQLLLLQLEQLQLQQQLQLLQLLLSNF